jgi:hypothetical protein
MSRRLNLILFLIGSAVFAWFVKRVGVSTLMDYIARTGWYLLLIVLLYGVVYAMNAWSWHLTMPEGHRPPFWRTYLIMLSGWALNFITPVIALGGEPYRAAATGAWMGTRRATGSVINYWLLHTLSHVLTWLTGILLALVVLPHTSISLVFLILGAVVLGFITAFCFSLLREGVLARTLAFISRVPVLRRVGAKLEARRPALIEMDEQISAFYHRSPRRFFLSLGIDYLSRALGQLEYSLIFLSVGQHLGFLQAYIMGTFISLFLNALFIFPMEAGTREGGLYLITRILGFAPRYGVYAAIVTRIRELCWIAIGLALLWATGSGRRNHAGGSDSDFQRSTEASSSRTSTG